MRWKSCDTQLKLRKNPLICSSCSIFLKLVGKRCVNGLLMVNGLRVVNALNQPFANSMCKIINLVAYCSKSSKGGQKRPPFADPNSADWSHPRAGRSLLLGHSGHEQSDKWRIRLDLGGSTGDRDPGPLAGRRWQADRCLVRISAPRHESQNFPQTRGLHSRDHREKGRREGN